MMNDEKCQKILEKLLYGKASLMINFYKLIEYILLGAKFISSRFILYIAYIMDLYLA